MKTHKDKLVGPCTKRRDLKFALVVELAQYTVVRFTRFLFGGFTTAAIVIQPDGKLVIAPLYSSKIAKAEWPECTSVQSSGP